MQNMAQGHHLTDEEKKEHAQEIAKPVRGLHCECCGYRVLGRQWNSEEDAGICPKCADFWEARGDRNMRVAFGVRGVHYDLTQQAIALNYLCGLILHGVEFPDALFRATQVYSIDAEELTRAYDAQY